MVLAGGVVRWSDMFNFSQAIAFFICGRFSQAVAFCICVMKRDAQLLTSSRQHKKQKAAAAPENLVPIQAAQLPEVGDGDNLAFALAPSQGKEGTEAAVSTRSHDVIAKPWGVESPAIVPQLPDIAASPPPAVVLKCVKEVAAYVVTMLSAFFTNHVEEFEAFGLDVQGGMHPSHYDALGLPTSDVALVLHESVMFGDLQLRMLSTRIFSLPPLPCLSCSLPPDHAEARF